MSPYTFRPAERADLPLLRDWLETPEVRRWWGDPAEQLVLLENDLGDPRMVMRVVALNGRPFAYSQDFDLRAWPQPHLAHLPPGSRGIDTFIGEPDMIGAGHGTIFLRQRAEGLRAEGAPLVATDPARANLRARRAYMKAGFSGDVEVEADGGPVVVMIFQT